ncbi:MAG TPA: M20/M25/M40 family metallo-hydrolase [Solirubrobacteraceae bacterium]|nr:M20/M25/M40 family metallo-hydrolase [Solirubrobacteraceae bacterium]
MRPASELERRRLNDLFAQLCAIPSPSGGERACMDRVVSELRALGLHAEEDGAAAATGAECGNVVVRIRGRAPRSVLLCAHVDTVAHDGPIEPVVDDGAWRNAHEGILGADNKAAVAVLLALAHRVALEGCPVGLELLFTVAEEDALAGARAFDVATLRSDWGYVFDHATPIGEVVMASPTLFRFAAHLHGRAAHAGIRPEHGRSAVQAAARAVAAMPLGRLDPETTASVASVHGGTTHGTNVVPDRCTVTGEVRSLDAARAEGTTARLVDHLHDAANDPECECDLDVTVEQLFAGYRHADDAISVAVAEAALRACGHVPRRITTGGGSDANALQAAGLACTNLANGTQRSHEPGECVSVAALEGMLDVSLALLEECAP